MLRQFLYLDSRLTRELLSQAEGGLYEEQKTEVESKTKGSAKGGLKLPSLHVGGSISQDERASDETTWQQTEASEFDRLYAYLTENGLVQMPPADEVVWTRLRRGDFVEIEAEIAPSPLATLRRLGDAAKEYINFADAIGQQVDEEARANIGLIDLLGGGGDRDFNLVVSVAEASDYKFRAKLSTDHLRYGVEEIEGEAIVVAKVGRKIQPGQRLQVDEMFGGAMQFVKGSDRRKAERGLEKIKVGDTPMGSMSLPFPAADLTPVAIFR
jgi:hypothetical protein